MCVAPAVTSQISQSQAIEMLEQDVETVPETEMSGSSRVSQASTRYDQGSQCATPSRTWTPGATRTHPPETDSWKS